MDLFMSNRMHFNVSGALEDKKEIVRSFRSHFPGLACCRLQLPICVQDTPVRGWYLEKVDGNTSHRLFIFTDLTLWSLLISMLSIGFRKSEITEPSSALFSLDL